MTLDITPISVGFDLRLHNFTVAIPAETTAVRYDRDGKTEVLQGSRDEILAGLRRAGFKVVTP